MMKHKKLYRHIFTAIICSLILYQRGFAQDSAPVDNRYYISYPDKLILRSYLSRKFAPFTISSGGKNDLNYKTNSKLDLGVGFTYKLVTINLSYGFGFLNKDKGQGDTKGLNLQFHLYPKKYAIDLIAGFLKGYYLDPKDQNGLQLTDYYKRPDLKRNIFGLSVFRVANSDRFSYKAAVNQKDWQTRSAGSLLYGLETYYGTIKSDSALVPSKAVNDFAQAGINKISFFTIGPGIGYAYTLVMNKHLFITGSAIGSLDLNLSSEEKNGSKKSKTKIIPGGIYKAALGYNSNTWTVSANLLGNALYTASDASSKEYFVPTGSVNFIVAKRIGVNRK